MSAAFSGEQAVLNQRPCILACGYRSVCIAKTNNKFPAWLVLLPSTDATDWKDTSNEKANHLAQSLTWSCHWRSKRDFLLLSRAVTSVLADAIPAKKNGQNCNCQNPHSKLRSLPKACFSKLCNQSPWKRPLLAPPHFVLPKLPVTATNLVDIVKESKDEYHASMKKNISQMDQFLLTIHTHASGNGCLENSSDAVELLQTAWRLFCRPIDCDDLVLSSCNRSENQQPTDTCKAFLLPTPHSLGQYFCTPQNAKQLVQLFIDKLAITTEEKSSQDSEEANQHNLVILEPSCGHGQLIWTLLQEHLEYLLQQYQTIQVIGIDLDPRAITVCQERHRSSPELHHHPNLSIQFLHQNFLTSQRPRSTLSELTVPFSSNATTVVAIGGPPYGSKPEERELPMQFIEHCHSEWDCRVIAFLVPQRFPSTLPPGILNDNYVSHSQELEDSTFLFTGKTAVKQPSRLECFYQRRDIIITK